MHSLVWYAARPADGFLDAHTCPSCGVLYCGTAATCSDCQRRSFQIRA